VRVEILDPVAPGLDREAFFAKLQHDIETATVRLIAEGARELGPEGAAHFARALE
jgi:1-acyl-sn-glycerol-3-phosphate acyltransferase